MGEKAAIPVAGDIQPDRAIAGQNGLGALAITLVGFILRALRARGIAQMLAELSAQGPLNQGLLEGRRGVFDGFSGHQPTAELLKQLFRDFR